MSNKNFLNATVYELFVRPSSAGDTLDFFCFFVSCLNFLGSMPLNEVEALKAQAQNLDFSGDDVGKVLLQQQAIQREERAV